MGSGLGIRWLPHPRQRMLTVRVKNSVNVGRRGECQHADAEANFFHIGFKLISFTRTGVGRL